MKFCKSVKLDKEIVYSNLPHFADYKDSTVLLIGGGPSTNELDLDATDRDFTWSCNHFYRNEKLKNVKVDLAMMMGEPNLRSEEFTEYRDKFEPFIGFESHDRWVNYDFDDYKKYFCMHTRFYSRLGIGVRMIVFACALGCKHIKFVGLDGYEPIYRGDHAFEPGKKTLPSAFSEKQYKDQYRFFWSYVKGLYPDVKFENLGGGKEFHE